MSDHDEINSMLKRIEENQQESLKMQREHLELAQAQLERSNQSIAESIELQKAAVARQAQVTKIVLPIIGVLLLLIVYLLFRWDIL